MTARRRGIPAAEYLARHLELLRRVALLFNKGHQHKEVAALLGEPMSYASDLIRQCRRRGLITGRKRRPGPRRGTVYGVRPLWRTRGEKLEKEKKR